MAQEEQQRCSNSSSGGGGKVVKKPKPKKIPQRGLGVAQLEKIRLEEIQKKEASSSPSPSPCVFVPLTHNHHHHHHQSSSSSSIPFSQPCPCPSISSSSPSSNNTLLKSSSSNALPLPNFDLFIPPPTLSTTTTSFYGFNNYNNSQETIAVGLGGASAATTTGHGYFSTMSNPCESNRDQDDVTELDPGFALRSRLQNDSNLPWPPLPVTMQRKSQPPSSMVNVCMSSLTSSGLNLQMEPPSNQSYYSNYTPPPHMWPEEEKTVGMKRPWPFSLDNPPGSSLPYKLPQFVAPPISRLDESSSCGNSGLFNFEPGNAVFREAPSGSTPIHIEWRGSSSELNSKNGSTETGALDGKFLTLGLPPTPSSTITSKAKQPLAFPTSRQRELSEYDMIPFPFQVYTEDPYFGSSGSVQQPPFYSFFPPRGQQTSRLTAKPNDQRSEIRDAVDLNLRL